MATVTSSLKLFDGMTGSLKNISKSMNFIVSAMDKLQSSFEKTMRVDELLVASNNKLITSENNLRQSLDKAAEAQKKNNRPSEEGSKGKNPIVELVKNVWDEDKASKKIRYIAETALSGAVDQMKVEDMFKAQTKDPAVGSAMFEKFKSEAIGAGIDVKEYLNSTLSFFPKTQNTDQLSMLNTLAQRLTAFDSTGGGIKGASKVLNDAMSGDTGALAERFNMSKKDIGSSKIEDLGKSGNVDGFLKAFDELLEKQQMGEKGFQMMLTSPVKQVEMFGNNIKSILDSAGIAVIKGLSPLLARLNADLQTGKIQAFFNGLGQGLSWVTDAAMAIYDAMSMIFGFISNNWGNIEPIIWGIVAAFGAWNIATFAQVAAQAIQTFVTTASTATLFVQTWATLGLAAAWGTLNTAMKANVFIIIASVIIGLIVWLYQLWETNDNFAAGLMRAWNSILNFFDTVPAYFWQLVEWMMQPFVSWAQMFGQLYDKVINGIISGINSVLGLVNKITGSSFEIGAKFNYEDMINGIADFAKGKKEAAYSNAAANAAQREQEVQDMVSSRASKRAAEEATKAKKDADEKNKLDKWNANLAPNIGRVDEVGKIADTVDVSSEDLKLMRELADIQSIQNFVTLTPTVAMTTGDINNGYDVDTIISRITKSLEEEVASSAQGVFS
ncbi:hypothetical protein [Paenibacillus sp. KN14-4R]|uniref:hypothetical protein n=1 Tax=Paenibacillus sp. KN14-4R TaxID=3445773 RepID=UPI003FA11CF5